MCRNFVRDYKENLTKLKDVSIILRAETRDGRTDRSECIKNIKHMKTIKRTMHTFVKQRKTQASTYGHKKGCNQMEKHTALLGVLLLVEIFGQISEKIG